MAKPVGEGDMPLDRAFQESALLPDYPEATLNRIATIARTLEDERSLPGGANAWLVAALRKISSGMDAQTALELCKTIWARGRDRDAFVSDFPIELAAAVGNAAEHAIAGVPVRL